MWARQLTRCGKSPEKLVRGDYQAPGASDIVELPPQHPLEIWALPTVPTINRKEGAQLLCKAARNVGQQAK